MSAVARSKCIGHRRESGIEIGVSDAATLARTTIMARRPAVDRTREIGAARRSQGAAQPGFHPVAKLYFRASQTYGGQELGIRQVLQTLSLAADTYVLLNEIVIGLQVLVAERPVVSIAVK